MYRVWDKKTVDLSAGEVTIVNYSCIVKGVYINEVTSNHPVEIKDGADTAYVVPSQAPAGHSYTFSPDGVNFVTSLVVKPNASATGNLTILFIIA